MLLSPNLFDIQILYIPIKNKEIPTPYKTTNKSLQQNTVKIGF